MKRLLFFNTNLICKTRPNIFYNKLTYFSDKKAKPIKNVVTLYDDLEIKRTATQKEIKASYNNLVKKYHPDIAGIESTDRFRRIQAAFGILRSPKKRRKYDDEINIQKAESEGFNWESSETGFNIKDDDMDEFYKNTKSTEDFYKDMNRVFIKDVDLKAEYDKFMAEDIVSDMGGLRIYENQFVRQ